MERVRFSLRLMLLIVALCAVCVALFRALLDLQQADMDRQRIEQEMRLAYEESSRRYELKDKIAIFAEVVQETRQQLDAIKNSGTQQQASKHAELVRRLNQYNDALHQSREELKELNEKLPPIMRDNLRAE